jgi:hypothetical protein
MPDSLGVAGATAAAPAANTPICTHGDLADGYYEVEVITLVTAAAPTNNVNFELRVGTVTVGILAGVQDRAISRKFWLSLAGTDQLILRTGAAAGGAGAIYNGEMIARRLSGF